MDEQEQPKKKRNRIRCKVDDLPAHIRALFDGMLADVDYTYQDISDFLKEQGYDVGKSSVGRFALRINNAQKRLLEATEQTKALIEVLKKNPDMDYTEPAMQIMSGELTRKFAAAQEEWDEMDLDKAGRLMVALSRTKVYKDKVRREVLEEVAVALDEFKKVVRKELEATEPELCQRLIEVAERVAKKLEEDDGKK